MTESDCEHLERDAPCECDVWADLGKRLLVEKLQTTASDPFDAMHAAAGAVREGEISKEELHECHVTLAEAEAAVALLEEIVDPGETIE